MVRSKASGDVRGPIKAVHPDGYTNRYGTRCSDSPCVVYESGGWDREADLDPALISVYSTPEDEIRAKEGET